MKKTPDITKPVMDRVVRFERKNTDSWQRRFIVSMAILVIITLSILWAIISVLSTEQSWSLLSIFTQDPEIIASYWRDTLWIFWQGVPQNYLLLGAIAIFLLIILWVFTGNKRKLIREKRRQLDKYV
ncbi:MAG TPA: hypothetical protein VMR81_07990 [Patescibacteria group bacterium]|nr:hypothetical protein [Patescibacteria group bacterium]